MSFVHLHNHTHYSLLDGLAKPMDYINLAKEQGAPAVAITDHGSVYGLVDFYKDAKKNDVKPILGCEIYISPKSRYSRDQNEKYYHLILLAENDKGYENLLTLVTKANLEGFYYKPRVDFELLKEFHEGLIATSACLQGEIPKIALAGNDEKTVEIIKKYQSIFGKENFFLELQYHPEITAQGKANEKLIELSSQTGAPLIVTNDCHYANKDDAEAHDILICIQTQSKTADVNRMRYDGDYSMKSIDELKKAFPDLPEAFSNTVEIAKRCNVKLKFDQNLLPGFQTSFNKEPGQYLRELCEEGVKERYEENQQEAAFERLNYELTVIDNMGFNTYFLIVHDFVNFAKNKGIIVGPGRGSAAGSIVAYSLKITDLDPLKYGLLFERFLNPERVSMPDIDIDFSDDQRQEVIDYVTFKYGRDKVAQIITFGTMAARAAVRDVGRVLGYSYSDVDKIAKMVPPPIQGRHTSLSISIQENPELSNFYKNNPDFQKILDMAAKLDGTIRQAGTHACAVVISRDPLTKFTALQRPAGDENGLVTQYSMKPLEQIGLLKMDFLGLKNLTILEKALQLILMNKNKDIVLTEIPLEDEKTFELLQNGTTTGVFQLESAGMKRYLRDLKPTCFEDIIAMVSLYRPGPMDWIPQYIDGKHGKIKIKYLHESLESILKETYGIALYQEQILKIAQVFAGFSLGEADLLRRAIGKKIAEELLAQKKKFIEGAVQKGYKEKLAKDIFEKVIEPFAAYGFNKSHAACYALISYQTAFLKANYPAEFMAALLTADAENTDRVVIEINECENMGIKVLPPSINQSLSDFTVVDDKTIRFGLNAIKGIGEGSVLEIIKARKDTQFAGLEDLLKRVPQKFLNKKIFEALSYSGALDCLEERNALIASVEEILHYAKTSQGSYIAGQTDIFGLMDDGADNGFRLKTVKPATRMQKLGWEKQYLGLYVSGHPLDGLKTYFQRKVTLAENINSKKVNKVIKVAGLLSDHRRVMTKAGSYMMYGKLVDPTGEINFVLFPRNYEVCKDAFAEDKLIIITGKIVDRGSDLQIVCNEAKNSSLDNVIKSAKENDIFNKNEKVIRMAKQSLPEEEEAENRPQIPPFVITLPTWVDNTALTRLKQVLQKFPGETEVELHLQHQGHLKKIRLPFKIDVKPEVKEKILETLSGE